MSMKIGIIGINRYAKFLNFACGLHVYAFQQFLTQHGYESTILNYKPVYFGTFDLRNPAPHAEAQYRKAVLRKAAPGMLQKLAELAVGYRSVVPERERRHDKFEAFVTQNLNFTEEIYDSDLLETNDPGFDCYICVTDVIWQSLDNHGFDRGFLLGSKAFEGKQKIAYAASRGASKDFSEELERRFFDYLRDIDAISVRERDFSEYIESRSDCSAPTVLDPVLLHDMEFWQRVSAEPREDRYLLLYYVMEQSTDTIAKAVEYAKLHDLTIVELSDRPLKHGKIIDPDVKHVARYDVGMEEWLGYIQHAEAVFTNSFHGCCFALIYETPLFVGKRNGQKVPNFLATFNLSNRQFSPDVDVTTLSPETDYRAAKELLRARRDESERFILDALTAAKLKVASHTEPDTAVHERARRALTYKPLFHSGHAKAGCRVMPSKRDTIVQARKLKSGAFEYAQDGALFVNDSSAKLDMNRFSAPGQEFRGWTMRFRVDNRWFWYMRDGSISPGDIHGRDVGDELAVFWPQQAVPHIPVNHISAVVFVAQWRAMSPTVTSRARRAITSAGQGAISKLNRVVRHRQTREAREPSGGK